MKQISTEISKDKIAQLTAILTGGGFKRAATKEAATKRFLAVAGERGIPSPEALLGLDFDGAAERLRIFLKPKPAAAPVPRQSRMEKIAAVVKKPASKPAAAKAEKEPTKRARLLSMVCTPEGATHAELCEALGWKSCLVTLRRAAAAAGVTIRVERVKGEPARYFGT